MDTQLDWKQKEQIIWPFSKDDKWAQTECSTTLHIREVQNKTTMRYRNYNSNT